MSNISMVEAKLPPGFRFHPRDEELVCDYLLKKVTHSDSTLMIEVDLNKCEPWDIPEIACVGGKDWYFYSQRDRKYATGLRTNRATASGYWKATGKDRPVYSKGMSGSSSLVGMRKTLVFYKGRAPKGKKTEWVMHEFRLEGSFAPPKLSNSSKEDWVLCRVFYKNREVVGDRPSLGISCFADTNGLKSLPPLMDSNYVSFDYQAAQNNANDQYEQVPCFSNNTIFPSNINPVPKHHHHHLPHMEEYYNNLNLTTKVGPTLSSTSGIIMPNNGPYSCDNEVLKAVLSHFTMLERNTQSLIGSPSLGEGSTSESHLSEVGMPNIWSHY